MTRIFTQHQTKSILPNNRYPFKYLILSKLELKITIKLCLNNFGFFGYSMKIFSYIFNCKIIRKFQYDKFYQNFNFKCL